MKSETVCPKAVFMCNSCFDKDKCNQDIFEQIFCKLDSLTYLFRKNNQNLEEMLKIMKKVNGGV